MKKALGFFASLIVVIIACCLYGNYHPKTRPACAATTI